MLYVISDKRDNSYFCGLSGWSKLEENALWYGEGSLHTIDEMNSALLTLKRQHGDHFYAITLPVEAN